MVYNKIQSQRIIHIEKIKAMITRCRKEKRDIDYKRFTIEIMSILKVTERTTKEYIKVALFELEDGTKT